MKSKIMVAGQVKEAVYGNMSSVTSGCGMFQLREVNQMGREVGPIHNMLTLKLKSTHGHFPLRNTD